MASNTRRSFVGSSIYCQSSCVVCLCLLHAAHLPCITIILSTLSIIFRQNTITHLSLASSLDGKIAVLFAIPKQPPRLPLKRQNRKYTSSACTAMRSLTLPVRTKTLCAFARTPSWAWRWESTLTKSSAFATPNRKMPAKFSVLSVPPVCTYSS